MVGALLVFVSAIVATAAPLPDPALEARAVALGAELRCVTCQAQSINDSSADMARNMRALVRERIAAGDSDADIRAYLQNRYGDFVLLRPPVQWNTLGLWLLPFILTLGAGWMVVKFIQQRGKGRAL